MTELEIFALHGAYVSLLSLPYGETRARLQPTLATLRDEIAGAKGLSSEEAQNSYETLIAMSLEEKCALLDQPELREPTHDRNIKVTIKGDNVDQIRDGCMTVATAIRPLPRFASPSQQPGYERTRYKARRSEQERNKERSGILRRAFKLIRHDPAQKSLVDNLAKALGGHTEITDELLATAHLIIDTHGQ